MASLLNQEAFTRSGAGRDGPSSAMSMRSIWASIRSRVRTRWLVVVFVLAGASALTVWNFQITLEQRDVESQLADLRVTADLVLPDPGGVNVEIAEAQENLNLTRALSIQGISDAQLSLQFIDLGRAHGIDVLFTDLEPESFEMVNDKDFPSKQVAVSAVGDVQNLIDYVVTLESGAIEGLEIQSSQITHEISEYKLLIDAIVFRQLADID